MFCVRRCTAHERDARWPGARDFQVELREVGTDKHYTYMEDKLWRNFST